MRKVIKFKVHTEEYEFYIYIFINIYKVATLMKTIPIIKIKALLFLGNLPCVPSQPLHGEKLTSILTSIHID